MDDSKPIEREATLSTSERCLLVSVLVLLVIAVIEGAVIMAAQNALSDTCEMTACTASSSQFVDATLALMNDGNGDVHAFRKRME